MKTNKFILLIATIFAVIAGGLTSCKYDDSELWNEVRDHESRIAQLEELCNQMNTNISSLQTIVSALQNNDYVTSIAPITSGDETIGYTINFSKSGPVTIYHGQDGKDGADGKDGHTPVLGVKMTSDGNYYWTIDGEWLLDDEGNKIRANGIDGQDGTDGSDGENGQDGQDGADGKDGITPQVKVENGYWYVSYDNGESWEQLGEATADNTPKLGIQQDSDGNYYWTVDGEWLLDNDGNKIRANGQDGSDGQDGVDGQDGITPQLKIEDGYWYVSYDNGIQWTQLWKATGEDGKDGADGKDGDSMFSRVTYDDDFVYLVLADNTTTLMIPRKDDEFSIIFTDGNDLVCSSGETVSIPYSLTYGDSDTEVAAIPHGGWNATVEKADNTSGNIIVTAPTPMKDGEIIILASDGKEKTIMRKLLFKQGVVSIVTKSYLTDSNASTIEIDLSTNLNYTVSIPDEAKSWISVSDIQTKATMRDDIVSLNIAANINDATRTATVSFVNSVNEVLNTITISQTGAKIANNEIWYISSDGNIIEPDTYDLSGTIVSNAYGNGRGVIVFEDDLTEIWDRAFYDKNNLVGITIPDGVTSIGSSAFLSCDNLVELDIPDGVTSIGEDAFYRCMSLVELVIPDGVTRIETRTFYGCNCLEKLIIPDGVIYIGQYAFAGVNFVKFIIPDGVTHIYPKTFNNCNNLVELTIPNGMTSISTDVFNGCNSLAVIYCKPIMPFQIGNSGIPAKTVIYVPMESVEAYKSNEDWSQYASQIVGYDFTE